MSQYKSDRTDLKHSEPFVFRRKRHKLHSPLNTPLAPEVHWGMLCRAYFEGLLDAIEDRPTKEADKPKDIAARYAYGYATGMARREATEDKNG